MTGVDWRPSYILHLGDGKLFYSQEELDKLTSIFSKKGIKLLSNFSQRLVFHVGTLEKIASKIEKINFSKLSNKYLIKLLNEYIKAALNAQCFLIPMLVADKVISKFIVDLLPKAPKQEKQNWLMALIHPIKENFQIKENKSFYKLAKFFNNPKFNKLLENHFKKYAIIGARAYWLNRYWRKKDILNRLKSFFDQKKNPIRELRCLNKTIRNRKIIVQRLTKRLNIKKSSLLYKFILLGRRYAFLRAWRTDIINGAGYKARNLFYEIARQAGIKNINDLAYLTYFEVIKLAKTEKLPISLKELKHRRKYFTEIIFQDRFIVISGGKWHKKLKNIVKEKITKTDMIKGKSVFPGKTEGIVKIVLSNKDIIKVKKGNILVAVMTFPHFIAAMEKAAAFVTDEGGILCHAAIISRELKKPCVIGTKIATRVLKDGDLVEVDANRGVVRII